MKNKFKNKSVLKRIVDKFQRRNRGRFYLIIKNYYYYYLAKQTKNYNEKRANILVQIKKSSKIAEIGVWRGEFSEKINFFCKPKELILVDPWIFDNSVRGCAPQVKGREPLNQNYFNDAKTETIKKFSNSKNVSIIELFSLEASKKFPDNYFDYIYIDGEHTYEAVTKDLECWFPKLKNKGLLFGDDYYWREEDNSLSLHKAYQDFIHKYKLKDWCVFKSQVCLQKN